MLQLVTFSEGLVKVQWSQLTSKAVKQIQVISSILQRVTLADICSLVTLKAFMTQPKVARPTQLVRKSIVTKVNLLTGDPVSISDFNSCQSPKLKCSPSTFSKGSDKKMAPSPNSNSKRYRSIQRSNDKKQSTFNTRHRKLTSNKKIIITERSDRRDAQRNLAISPKNVSETNDLH